MIRRKSLHLSRINDKKRFTMKKNILLLVFFAIVAAMPARAEEPTFEAEYATEAPTGIMTESDAEFQDIQIILEGSQVRISGGEGLTLEIFNLAGYKVNTTKIDSDDKVVNLNLKPGCYILKVGKVVRKISIRQS